MAQHSAPLRDFYLVFATLLLLTLITVEMAFFNFGFLRWISPALVERFGVLAALGIASLKATLVLLFFMHVRYSPPLTWIFAAAGFLWLVILIVFTLSDFWTRGWLPAPEAW